MIEAITEDLDGKLEMWGELDGIVKDDAFFATNTSSLSVAQQAAATKRPERFLGLHFFNPAQVMPAGGGAAEGSATTPSRSE